MARMIVADHEYVSKRYNLHKLKEVEELVAEAVQVCSQVHKHPCQVLTYSIGQHPLQQSYYRILRK